MHLKLTAYSFIFCVLLCSINASWISETVSVTDEAHSGEESVDTSKIELAQSKRQNGLAYLSWWGSGMTDTIKSSLLKFIDNGQAFHGKDYEKHAKYIGGQLASLDGGYWGVFLIPNVKLKNDSDFRNYGFNANFYMYDQKFAFLLKACQYDSTLGHIVFKRYEANSLYLRSDLTTSNIDSSDLTIAKNIGTTVTASSLTLGDLVGSYKRKLEEWQPDSKWSLICTNFENNGSYPDAFGIAYGTYITYATFSNQFRLKYTNAGVNVITWKSE